MQNTSTDEKTEVSEETLDDIKKNVLAELSKKRSEEHILTKEETIDKVPVNKEELEKILDEKRKNIISPTVPYHLRSITVDDSTDAKRAQITFNDDTNEVKVIVSGLWSGRHFKSATTMLWKAINIKKKELLKKSKKHGG